MISSPATTEAVEMKLASIMLMLLLGCGIAHADGVTLFTAANATSSESAKLVSFRALPSTKSIAGVVDVNRFAVDSTIINAVIDGQAYQFIGSMSETGVSGADAWAGRTPSGDASATIVRVAKEGQMDATFRTKNGVYRLAPLGTHFVLLATKRKAGSVTDVEPAPVRRSSAPLPQ